MEDGVGPVVDIAWAGGQQEEGTRSKYGDRICGTQRDPLTIHHRYGRSWYNAAPDRLTIEGGRFCIEMLGEIQNEPGWRELRFTELRGFVPSFKPNGIPLFETGPNHITLGSLPSKGKLHEPTGIVVAELQAKLVNDLFRFEYPIPIRAGLRGRIDSGGRQLVIEQASVTAITPPDYRGPLP